MLKSGCRRRLALTKSTVGVKSIDITKDAVLAAIGSLYGTEFKFCIDDTPLDKI